MLNQYAIEKVNLDKEARDREVKQLEEELARLRNKAKKLVLR